MIAGGARARLGPIHRLVRRADQRLRIDRVPHRGLRQTDADGQRNAGGVAMHPARGEAVEESAPLDEVGRRQENAELVAAETVGEVRGAAGAVEACRHLAQRGVARLMPVGVVELLEAVEIEEHQDERHVLALGAGQLAPQVLVKRAVVAEVGERVAAGLLLKLAGALVDHLFEAVGIALKVVFPRLHLDRDREQIGFRHQMQVEQHRPAQRVEARRGVGIEGGGDVRAERVLERQNRGGVKLERHADAAVDDADPQPGVAVGRIEVAQEQRREIVLEGLVKPPQGVAVADHLGDLRNRRLPPVERGDDLAQMRLDVRAAGPQLRRLRLAEAEEFAAPQSLEIGQAQLLRQALLNVADACPGRRAAELVHSGFAFSPRHRNPAGAPTPAIRSPRRLAAQLPHFSKRRAD
ncbi:hypothetical protein KL86APRO_11350 [uncultured Alphaproteobacteria bacterium]|uniref:Uncharacterized protein n=1 Tax=uncultured Alphaproteobacteria bacterium TaxID=91750 RepID=A0A212JN55_9PROT|nr:hypothetical protein KL86APRO_11350 [uncultured Alphaproteobacteria bacterium]